MQPSRGQFPTRGSSVIRVNPSVTAAVHPAAKSLTYTRAASDGSSLVVRQRYGGGESRLVNAYSTRTDAAKGTETRTYLDGRREERGKNFTRIEVPGRYATTIHADGLREANRADGKPLFRDSWQNRQVAGVERREIVRTVYAETINDRVVEYGEPVRRTYFAQRYYGVLAYAYQPVVFAAGFYSPFAQPFAQPIRVAPGCHICPAPVVAFEHPVAEYSDPMDLVGDLEISTALSDNVEAPTYVSGQAPPPSAEVSYLSQQVADLQQQVDSAKTQDAQLSQELAAGQSGAPADGPVDMSLDPTIQPPPAPVHHDPAPPRRPPPTPADPTLDPTIQSTHLQMQPQSPSSALPEPTMRPAVAYMVPDPVRKQIHDQVRDNVKLHQANQALTWPELVSSGKSRKFIFQVSDSISTVDTNGEDCALTGGDMLKLDEGAAPDDPSLRMRVVVSKPSSCRVSAVVNLSVADAQNMLNDFNTRQENVMKQVHGKLTGTTEI